MEGEPSMAIRDARVKWTYVTRTIPERGRASIGPHAGRPRAGDLVVARVGRIGEHGAAEDPYGRRMRLYQGDLLVGAYGNRYATDFYEGYVPEGPDTHLLTAGGLIGTVAAAHDAHERPTELEVIGRLVDGAGRPLSLEDFGRAFPIAAGLPHAHVVAVLGTSMNAGKTTTAAAIVRAFTRAGFPVGAGKVTGSGSGKDRWSYADAGAHALAHFLDFGMASTFGYPLDRLGTTMLAIRDALILDGSEVVVLEIADGLLQSETAWLLERLPGFVDAVVFAATDALSARSGVEILRAAGAPVRAVSGLLTRSPLAVREAEAATGLPVVKPSVLADGAAVDLLAPEPALA